MTVVIVGAIASTPPFILDFHSNTNKFFCPFTTHLPWYTHIVLICRHCVVVVVVVDFDPTVMLQTILGTVDIGTVKLKIYNHKVQVVTLYDLLVIASGVRVLACMHRSLSVTFL